MDIARPNHGVTKVEEMKAPITTGDTYMAEHGLTRIDFLKIDVEGAELSVLNGFGGAFRRKAIDVVQFEYGQVNLRTRVFLENFWRFFEIHVFVVGKLSPRARVQAVPTIRRRFHRAELHCMSSRSGGSDFGNRLSCVIVTLK